MAPVTFTVYKTNELSELQLASLVRNFNTVFEKDIKTVDLIRRYVNNEKGFSYHSLMETECEVVGYFSAVPYNYSYFGREKIFCYLGNLFIMPGYRKDALAFFKMYRNAKELLIAEGVSLLMAVPNKNSYPYFIHALKWKEVSTLPYYALPVKVGTVLNKKFLNVISEPFIKAQSIFNAVFTFASNSKEAVSDIFLVPKEPLMEQHRYSDAHRVIKKEKFSAFYRVIEEEGINTAYLIDFYNSIGKRDSYSLRKAVEYIIKNESPDLVLFIGELKMFQTILFRVPKNKEPRPLNFCVEILDKTGVNERAYDVSSWNFGLYNFDVR
ncbi:hypothetical protein [Ferruginibacter sp.]|uniref:hypothetical protein n=1 Tax=Ferruginibacter sp. TaxID=1940288 RepID=UPI0019A8786C|nr:hypothetical protein [Ferruginibacter sp.]MBC7629234.1 hypothetical protein [Ferruginibacter sp.]